MNSNPTLTFGIFCKNKRMIISRLPGTINILDIKNLALPAMKAIAPVLINKELSRIEFDCLSVKILYSHYTINQ